MGYVEAIGATEILSEAVDVAGMKVVRMAQ